MPGSFNNFDLPVRCLLQKLQPGRVLDIGCGSGKYGRFARECVPAAHLTGIEIEASYIERFQLRSLYDEVRVGDAWNELRRRPEESFDLCIIGDCIEHMPKSQGLDLLNLLAYRTQYTLVLFPEFSVQGAVNGIDSETHVSVWSEDDFLWHDRWAWDNCFTITMVVMRGYQSSPVAFENLVNAVNGEAPYVQDFYSGRMLRPVQLRKRVRVHEDVIDGVRHGFRPA